MCWKEIPKRPSKDRDNRKTVAWATKRSWKSSKEERKRLSKMSKEKHINVKSPVGHVDCIFQHLLLSPTRWKWEFSLNSQCEKSSVNLRNLFSRALYYKGRLNSMNRGTHTWHFKELFIFKVEDNVTTDRGKWVLLKDIFLRWLTNAEFLVNY